MNLYALSIVGFAPLGQYANAAVLVAAHSEAEARGLGFAFAKSLFAANFGQVDVAVNRYETEWVQGLIEEMEATK